MKTEKRFAIANDECYYPTFEYDLTAKDLLNNWLIDSLGFDDKVKEWVDSAEIGDQYWSQNDNSDNVTVIFCHRIYFK